MSSTADPPAMDDAWLDDAFSQYVVTRSATLRDEIITRTSWIATRGARRFSDRGEPHDDLVQVARIGLLHAVERFDPAMGVPFGAYATPTIMGELRRHFRDRTWAVYVPRRAKDMRGAVATATEDLAGQLHRAPSVTEIAGRLGVRADLVIEALEANSAHHTAQLEAIRHTADAGATFDVGFDAVLDREVLAGVLTRLPARERNILGLRFYEELSQSQIAERIGTSQVHVGRLITSSLATLRALIDDDAAGTG